MVRIVRKEVLGQEHPGTEKSLQKAHNIARNPNSASDRKMDSS